jgi:hypothetical protein
MEIGVKSFLPPVVGVASIFGAIVCGFVGGAAAYGVVPLVLLCAVAALVATMAD